MVAQLQPTPVAGRILNGSFAMITNQVSMNPDISPSARLLYVILVAKAGRSGWCDETLDELGVAYGATARQIQRLLERLLERGMILERPDRTRRGRAKLYAPIVGLTEARLHQVLAFAGQPRHRVANTTDLSYLPPSPSDPNTTFLVPDMSCLGAPNTTFLAARPGSPLIDRYVDGIDPENGTAPPAPAPAPEPPPPAVVVAATAKPLLPVPKPTPRPTVEPAATDDPSPEPAPAPPDESSARRPARIGAVAAGVEEVWEHYRAKIQPRARARADEKIAARLKTFTVEEIKDGIDHFAADWWRMENNASNGARWFFETDDQVDKWVTLEPRPPKGSERRRAGRSEDVGWTGKPGGGHDRDLDASISARLQAEW